MLGRLRIIDQTGDSIIAWDTAEVKTVEEARASFGKKLEQAYSAYAFHEGGGAGEVITTFDPTATMIILAPQMAGG